jgi:hypothetical protein
LRIRNGKTGAIAEAAEKEGRAGRKALEPRHSLLPEGGPNARTQKAQKCASGSG